MTDKPEGWRPDHATRFSSTRQPEKPGNPGIYDDSMPKRLLDFFNKDVNEYLIHNLTAAGKSNYQIKPDGFPTLQKFARMIGVQHNTLQRWKQHPEWAAAMNDAMRMQEEAAVNIGIATNGQFAQFLLKCCHGWRDSEDLNVNTAGTGTVTVNFTRGKTKEERDAEAAQADEDGE